MTHRNRSLKTGNTRWMSVSTPSVFREIKVLDITATTTSEERKMEQLERLAQEYGTHVETTSYPRG